MNWASSHVLRKTKAWPPRWFRISTEVWCSSEGRAREELDEHDPSISVHFSVGSTRGTPSRSRPAAARARPAAHRGELEGEQRNGGDRSTAIPDRIARRR